MTSRTEAGRLARCGAWSAGSGSPGGLRTTMFRGRELSYEVIDGWAVHDGDIVLGRAEEMEPAQAGAGPEGGGIPGPGWRRRVAPISKDSGWPGGIIPYEIVEDATDEERRNILAGMTSWSERTTIEFVPRTGQEYYILLTRSTGFCRSGVGPGSPTPVFAVGCTIEMTHELGHAIGLWHGHERSDAAEYGMRSEPVGDTMDLPRTEPDPGSIFPTPTYNAPAEGPFDLLSVMTYGVSETIPPGLHQASGNLVSSPEDVAISAGDVAGVNRLYGQPSEATVVTTNPPGLEIVVDGNRVATPATFYWPAGSSHELEAPLWQVSGSSDSVPRDWAWHVFGRWTDGGDRVHEFTARPGETWVEASFTEQERAASTGPGLDPDEVRFEDNFVGFDATPRALTFIHKPGSELAAQVVRLTNRADGPRRYGVSTDSQWLAADRFEASLGPGESVDIEVSALPTGLPAERYSGELRIWPSDPDLAELQQVQGMPVAFVVLPEIVPVQLGAGSGTVGVAVSATEGFLGEGGRPLGRGGRVTRPSGDTYVLAEVPGGVSATLELRSQTLELPAGGTVTLAQHGEGDWRIGADRVFSGHRYAAGGHEYVLELADGLWRVAPYAIRDLAGLGPGPYGYGHYVPDMAVDSSGSVYLTVASQVRKIDASGTITTLAGTGVVHWGGFGPVPSRNTWRNARARAPFVRRVRGTGNGGPFALPVWSGRGHGRKRVRGGRKQGAKDRRVRHDHRTGGHRSAGLVDCRRR